jgi:hypothetical protein
MSKPTTKNQLLADILKERQALEQFLATLSPEQMTVEGVVGYWAVKDVLAHLLEWEQMVPGWYVTGLRGETPHVPAEGYNWGQLPQLNQSIYMKHHDRRLEDILAQFHASYQHILATVQGLSESDLFTPGLYPWMNKNTLAAYFTSCTSSHYRWARTEMRKRLKAL